MKTFNSIDKLISFMKSTKDDLLKSHVEAANVYVKEEIPKRFNFGNTYTYGYSPNTISYENLKLKKFGKKPQLVATGKLSNMTVNNIVIDKSGIHFRYPKYGQHQIELGRNFLQWRKKDTQTMMTLIRKFYRRSQQFR